MIGVELLMDIISMQFRTSVQKGYEMHFRDNKNNKKKPVGHEMAQRWTSDKLPPEPMSTKFHGTMCPQWVGHSTGRSNDLYCTKIRWRYLWKHDDMGDAKLVGLIQVEIYGALQKRLWALEYKSYWIFTCEWNTNLSIHQRTWFLHQVEIRPFA